MVDVAKRARSSAFERVQHQPAPPRGNRSLTADRAEQRTSDGAIGVGVAAAIDHVDQRGLYAGRVQQLPKRPLVEIAVAIAALKATHACWHRSSKWVTAESSREA